MKYLDQTKFGPDEGNCFAACVASLLCLSIEDVPCFNVPGKNWLRLFEEWLEPRGLAPLVIWSQGGIIPSDVHYLAGGKSPRGIPHSVIYRNGVMVHDPHPSREGLEGEPTDYTFLVPSDSRALYPETEKVPVNIRGLKSLLSEFPDDSPIYFQVAAEDGSAWNMAWPTIGYAFQRTSGKVFFTLRHPSLKTMPEGGWEEPSRCVIAKLKQEEESHG